MKCRSVLQKVIILSSLTSIRDDGQKILLRNNGRVPAGEQINAPTEADVHVVSGGKFGFNPPAVSHQLYKPGLVDQNRCLQQQTDQSDVMLD